MKQKCPGLLSGIFALALLFSGCAQTGQTPLAGTSIIEKIPQSSVQTAPDMGNANKTESEQEQFDENLNP